LLPPVTTATRSLIVTFIFFLPGYGSFATAPCCTAFRAVREVLPGHGAPLRLSI
jgi:hypothetical protein